MKKARNIYSIMMIMLFCLSSLSTAYAQSDTATLSGTVTDPNGAVIPGAVVTVANPATGFTRETTASGDGIYAFPSLVPGTYTVTARGGNFSTTELKDVVLNVNDKRSLQIQLQVGDVGTTVVQVTAESSQVDENPAVTTTVDRTFAERLPLNGRSFQSLITLSPGIVVSGTNFSDQGQFNVNGQRASSNGFYVDGVSANFGGASGANLYQFAGGSLPALSAQGGTNNLVSVDALQEFTIQTSTYAPEFGRQPGAQISILTRSGTNRYSGAVFEYFRNEILDANDFFINARPLTAQQIAQGLTKQPRVPLRQNQFGGVFGGPLPLPNFGEGGPVFSSGKDRTFFFFSYEGLRLLQPQNRITDVPTVAARQNAPVALRPFLNAFPLPNGPVSLTDPNAAEFSTSFSDPSDLNTYSIRLDHTVNKRLQIFGRYNDATSSSVQRAAGAAASVTQDTGFTTRTLTFGAISPLTSKLVNDLRFNYSTHRVASIIGLDTYGGAVPFTSAAFFGGTPQPFTEETGLFSFQVFGMLRSSSLLSGLNTTNTQRQTNIVDHFSVVKGNHSLRFGVDYRRLSPIFAPRSYVAIGFYNNFSDVVADRVGGTQIQQSVRGVFGFKNLGFYAQDTWKATPRLTLTYGLRYDLDYAPNLVGADPLTVTSAGFDDPRQLALAPQGTPLFKTTYNNFAPRVGVAYQLRQTAGWETVARGGFGVFYDLASQYVGQIAQVTFPPFGALRQTNGPGFCAIAGQPLGCALGMGGAIFPLTTTGAVPPPLNRSTTGTSGLTYINPEIKLPYSYQWNVAVEQRLWTDQTLSVSYVASRGYRLLQAEQVFGVATNPNFNAPILIDNFADSQYDSMQVQFQRRLSRGLQAIASYTWAHSIDSASTAGIGASATNTFSRSRGAEGNRANSDFDIRHAFNAAVSYNLPTPFENRAARAVLGGWALDNIFTFRTALPLSITTFGLLPPGETATIRPDVVPGVPIYLFGDQFPGGRAINPAAFTRPPFALDPAGVRRITRQGNAGRNQFRGFGAFQWDLAVRRQFTIREAVRLQFRADFFNVMNRANFGGVVTGLGFNATTGLPAPSATFGRATSLLGRSLGSGGLGGGFSPLYQIGGPRSIQLSVKLLF